MPASTLAASSRVRSRPTCRSQQPTKVRVDHQPQDRQSARPRRAAVAARPRRRGDRIELTQRGRIHDETSPPRNFCIWPRALPRCRPSRASLGRKPIRRGRCASIVGFAAGGATDILARLIGQWLSERLGQPFVVENRPGAGSNIGTEAVVKSPAGRLHASPGQAHANTINATLYDKLNFNFIRDIAPVAGIVRCSFRHGGPSIGSGQDGSRVHCLRQG